MSRSSQLERMLDLLHSSRESSYSRSESLALFALTNPELLTNALQDLFTLKQSARMSEGEYQSAKEAIVQAHMILQAILMEGVDELEEEVEETTEELIIEPTSQTKLDRESLALESLMKRVTDTYLAAQ